LSRNQPIVILEAKRTDDADATMNEISDRAIRKLIDGLVDAWNCHDAGAFADAFAVDADFTNVFGMRAKGRSAIFEFHAPLFETMFKHSRLTATAVEVRFLRPDVAAVDVHWEMSGARDPKGNEWPLRHGLMNLVVTNEQGSWLIAVMHNMDLPSDEMAKAQEELQRQSKQP
jgi:uncharacterized protein (TIGR02246 family)